jgi:hypothetical protein
VKYYADGTLPELAYHVPTADRQCVTCGQLLEREQVVREYVPGRWRWEWIEQPELCSQDFIDGLDIT